MVDARETSDSLDSWSAGSNREARETADSLDSWSVGTDREARETADYIDSWYQVAPAAFEARCTQVGATIFWLAAVVPPGVAEVVGCGSGMVSFAGGERGQVIGILPQGQVTHAGGERGEIACR